ncbi:MULTISPECIES: PhnD/SsuA/transferrin family substrate-binding protein [unclassified Yoonia]|uniref:substrate-binding domain-containing protein n=1 Tax=unclassified Yoonia TaxID=2629118 RepID=UPI002AFE64CA|nr:MULTISPECIES: PhnD/SsuA/transferrin family substrate-binding protein [unclassified Yoonia]
MAFTRRASLSFAGAAAALTLAAPRLGAQVSFRLGLTPVFRDNDAAIIEQLRATLGAAMGRSVELVQRRTYQEVTGLLLGGAVDAAWLCGYPYLQHQTALSLVAVPLWRGAPRYRSYLIAAPTDDARALADLEGSMHAFSDPDSNSGYLVTASDLARARQRPENFFARTIFTYGHRNVVRAVGAGLVRSGSVDGYVWETLASVEPDLTAQTKVIARSEWLGFPPFCARADRMASPNLRAFQSCLLNMSATEEGRRALALLQLDGMVPGTPALFDGIARRLRDFDGAR